MNESEVTHHTRFRFTPDELHRLESLSPSHSRRRRSLARDTTIALEARSGIDPFVPAELPVPPTPRGLGWASAVGPGVIVLGASIGGGEFLLGPTVFVRHGLTLLWVTTVAVFFQTVFNTELMRYTIATGEPVFTGFMRTRPHAVVWAWFYAVLFFLQVGWPASAGVASGAIFFLFTGRMPGPADVNAVYLIGVCTFLLCVTLLLVGRRIERTLELLNWIMVVCTLGGLLVLSLLLVPSATWVAAVGGTGWIRHRRGASSTSCRRTRTSSCSRPSSPTPAAAG